MESSVHLELWAAPGGDSSRATQLPFNGEPGRVVATSSERIIVLNQQGEAFALRPDGSGQTALLPGRSLNFLAECGPNATLLFTEFRDGALNVWKADSDGSNAVQLTHEKRASLSACTPDGKSYISWQAPDLYIRDINGSSAPSKLDMISNAGRLRISPDGTMVASIGFVEGPPERMAFTFAPLSGGKPHYIFENVPATATWGDWSPDGKGFDYAVLRKGAANVWHQSMEGGPYQQVTKFNTTVMSSFRWSPDGKMLYVTRGTRSADIVLLRDTK